MIMRKRPRQATYEGTIIGMAWFDRTQWNRLTEIVDDRSELDDTFEQWRRSARKAMRNIEREGHRVEKAWMDVDALVAWCEKEGLPVNGGSRAQYVSALLKERFGSAKT
jgi:hypothetical protein